LIKQIHKRRNNTHEENLILLIYPFLDEIIQSLRRFARQMDGLLCSHIRHHDDKSQLIYFQKVAYKAMWEDYPRVAKHEQEMLNTK
jgi:hypothetical protein